MSDVTPEALHHLAETCDRATFGLNHENVLDESYRKAGKLDAPNFELTPDPLQCGLIDVVQADLLEERYDMRPIKAKRYKLNVYGI